MNQKFSDVVMGKIEEFISERGIKNGVPADIAYHIVETLPTGNVRIRDESWDEKNKWIFRGELEIPGQEPVQSWLVKNGNEEAQPWENDEFEMVGPAWTVQILPLGESLGVKKVATSQEEVVHADPAFLPADNSGEDTGLRTDLTFGQVIDAIFAAHPGTLAIRSEEWNNATAWVLLEEVETHGEKLTILTINYSNGIKSPWHPSALDLRSKAWISQVR